MKRNIILCLALVFAFSACLEDKGNYDYHAVNEVTISGIAASYTALPGMQTIVIDPKVEMTDGDPNDLDRFEYMWLAIVAYTSRDTLSKERVLTTDVEGLSSRTYDLSFKVIDRKTKLTWKSNTKLVVANAYSKGLLLAGWDSGGNAEAQMISMVADTLATKELLKDSGLPTLTNPISFLHTGSYATRLWMFTGSGSYYLDTETMLGSTSNVMKNGVWTKDVLPDDYYPVTVAPVINNVSGNVPASGWWRAYVTNTGHIFNTTLTSMGGDYYTNPSNRTETKGTLFKAKPYLIYGLREFEGFVWYDEDNERFLYTDRDDDIASVIGNYTEEFFPWSQAGTGRTLVYAENTLNTDGGSEYGNSYALMKDNSNNYFIYKFYVAAEVSQRGYFEVKSNIATNFNNATMYAFSSTRTLVFYVAGNKLYAYDYNPGLERCVSFDIFDSDDITMIKADVQVDTANNPLYIATYNSSMGGTLQKYTVGTNPDVIEITPRAKEKWTGLIKVKDVTWRAAK